MARDILELLNHLQWERFHLVGLSMGGMISLELSFLGTILRSISTSISTKSFVVLERLLSLSLFVTHAGGLTGLPQVLCLILFTTSHSLRNIYRI